MTAMYYRNTNFSGFNIIDLHRFLVFKHALRGLSFKCNFIGDGGIQLSRQHGFLSFRHDHPEGPEPSVVMG